jgi:hypothetical protein
VSGAVEVASDMGAPYGVVAKKSMSI